jgi:glycosyltransferase involved in cell wall biosynthesis
LAERVKILHVTTRLNVGGIATQVFGYCEGLQKLGYDVELVTGHIEAHEEDATAFLGAPPCPTRTVRDLGRAVDALSDLRALRETRRVMRRFRPDVVHTHAAKAGTIGRIAAVPARVPVRVHSFHGHVFHGYFRPLVSRGVVMFERQMARLTSAIAVPGESQRREMADRFRIAPEHKIVVTPYGVDLRMYGTRDDGAAIRREFGLTTRHVIGAIGRMAPVKNQALLIDAFADLRARRQDVSLLLVGDGECREALERQAAARDLTGAVVFRKWEPDLSRVYAALDVLAISSLNEGMPVAALEAMASGVAVVSTAVGGVVDLIADGDTGWLVPSGHRAMLTGALDAALDDGARAGVVGRASAFVRSRHSFDRATETLAGIYDRLLRARS